MPRLAPLALASLLLACAAEREPPPSITLSREDVRMLAGAPVRLTVYPRHCAGTPMKPVLTQAGGGPAPAWVEMRCVRALYDGYFVGNPGSGTPFPVVGPPPDPCALVDLRTTRCVSERCAFVGYELELDASAQEAAALLVHVPGCDAPPPTVAVEVVGATDLGGFCGASTGAACDDAGDCAATCSTCGEPVEVAAGETPLCSWTGAACLEPDQSVSCGCVAGACAWHGAE